MVQYAETQHAFEEGIKNTSPEKGVTPIEKWEESLNDVETSEAKAILRDLGQLKTAIQADRPDGGKIKTVEEARPGHQRHGRRRGGCRV